MNNKTNMKTKKCFERYVRIVKKLIWDGFSRKEIAKKCNLDPSIISDDIRRFGNKDDIKKINENKKIKLKISNKTRKIFGENHKRLKKSKDLFFNIIKPSIWKGETSVDIAIKNGYSKNGDVCIRKHVKRFGSEED
jgi:predicted DNA-binding protein YlxM (UPF0122 family)